MLHAQIPNSMLYHSKMKKDVRESVLEAFSNNTCRYLIAVDALNEGLNVPDADAAICVSGVSTQLVQNQQSGRIGRVAANKKALFVNLVSKDTIEERWVRNKTAGINNVR